jgi:hypothetical protein
VQITRGVPQGSILGPVLFNLYYNDVISEFSEKDITLFADDTAIVASAHDCISLQSSLQTRLNIVDEHLCSLNMELNTDKTKTLIFMNDTVEPLNARGATVQSCSTFKYLGIHIDSDLSWTTHIDHLINRIHKMLYVVYRCTGKSSADRRCLLFRAYLYPHFLYGIQLYMFCTATLRAKLEALLRRCCRIVLRDTGTFPVYTTKSVYLTIGVLPLRLTFQHSSATILYSALVLGRVPAIRSLFECITQTSVNARRIPQNLIVLRIPRVRTERAKHSFAYWGAKLWNSIPAHIRRSQSFSSFSNAYHAYLLLRLDLALNDLYNVLDFV